MPVTTDDRPRPARLTAPNLKRGARLLRVRVVEPGQLPVGVESRVQGATDPAQLLQLGGGPGSAPPSPATPSAPASGNPPSKHPASTSTSASTTSATPTPPGSSPAAQTSNPSWTAWATPKSKPPRNTSTPSPTPTNATSTPSPASKNSPSTAAFHSMAASVDEGIDATATKAMQGLHPGSATSPIPPTSKRVPGIRGGSPGVALVDLSEAAPPTARAGSVPTPIQNVNGAGARPLLSSVSCPISKARYEAAIDASQPLSRSSLTNANSPVTTASQAKITTTVRRSPRERQVGNAQ